MPEPAHRCTLGIFAHARIRSASTVGWAGGQGRLGRRQLPLPTTQLGKLRCAGKGTNRWWRSTPHCRSHDRRDVPQCGNRVLELSHWADRHQGSPRRHGSCCRQHGRRSVKLISSFAPGVRRTSSVSCARLLPPWPQHALREVQIALPPSSSHRAPRNHGSEAQS